MLSTLSKPFKATSVTLKSLGTLVVVLHLKYNFILKGFSKSLQSPKAGINVPGITI